MIDDIMFTFDKNFGRLNNLISLYSSVSAGSGRKPTSTLDLLRATTVLAHATLEDYLRSLLIWKLPFAPKDKLNRVPLIGTSEIGRATKFELGDLVGHKGHTIEELIQLSVVAYLGTVSFNDTSDIVSNLGSISIPATDRIKALFPSLNEMIKRRHNIVHRADRNDSGGSGNHTVKSISLGKVQEWKSSIDKFVKEVNQNFYV